jgi:hypothetical protein
MLKKSTPDTLADVERLPITRVDQEIDIVTKSVRQRGVDELGLRKDVAHGSDKGSPTPGLNELFRVGDIAGVSFFFPCPEFLELSLQLLLESLQIMTFSPLLTKWREAAEPWGQAVP